MKRDEITLKVDIPEDGAFTNACARIIAGNNDELYFALTRNNKTI